MKSAIGGALLCVLASLQPAPAAQCAARTPEFLAEVLTKYYSARNLAALDGLGLRAGTVTLRITHSISDDVDRVFKVSRLSNADAILERYSKDGLPGANVWPLDACSANKCEFHGSQLHNNLFLSSFTFRQVAGCSRITGIVLEDGD